MASIQTYQNTVEELRTQVERLRQDLFEAQKRLADLETAPLVWTLQIDGRYLNVRHTFESARAWGYVIGQGECSRQNPGSQVAVVTA
jgi:hypothetical protein